MSALGDALSTKNREAAALSKLEVFVDSAADAASVTFSVRLLAPSFAEVLLQNQTDLEVAAALTEFTDWATALW